MDRLKILLISTAVFPLGSSHYGGIEKLVYDYAEELSKSNEVSVACPIGSRLPKNVEHIKTVDVLKWQDREDLAFFNYCYMLRDFDAIIDFSHEHYAGRLEKNLPLISIVWDPIEVKYPKSPYNIVCVSLWQKRMFEKVYKQKAIHAKIVCANEKRYTLEKQKSERFLFIGKMSPEKGALTAIKFAKKLGYQLDIVGSSLPTDRQDYKYEVIRKCDGKQIRWLGDVSDEVKIELLKKAKALVYPRKANEAFHHASVEAMLCGTPVIAYKHSCMPEIIEHGKTGYLAKSDEEFLKAMKNVDCYDYEAIRDHAMKFSRTNVIKEIMPLLHKVKGGERWR